MNPLVLLVVPVIALFLWILSTALRTGEFQIKSGSATHTIRRAEQPQAFWLLAALYISVICYIAYTAWQVA